MTQFLFSTSKESLSLWNYFNYDIAWKKLAKKYSSSDSQIQKKMCIKYFSYLNDFMENYKNVNFLLKNASLVYKSKQILTWKNFIVLKIS